MNHWTIQLLPEFEAELDELSEAVQDKLLAHAEVLQELGPNLGRPLVDTLIGSCFGNMKELRFDADGGVWRVAFAFDPKREAILLVAGNKRGQNQNRFYKQLIETADDRYRTHLEKNRNI